MSLTVRLLVAAIMSVSVVSAQQLSVTVSPNPAPLGATITVTAQAAVPNRYTPFGCLVTSVRSGTPNGPTVRLFACTYLSVAIPLYGGPTFRTATWNQAVGATTFATPGVYWFQIDHTPGQFGSPTSTEWYSVTIDDPSNPAPVLSAASPALFGSAFNMSLVAGGNHAFENYGIALSVTTNTGIPFTGGIASLDPDWLFQFSVTFDPNFFVNFTGGLNYLGASYLPIQLLIPPASGILCVPIHAQAVVFPAAGGILLSNDLPIPIH